MRVQQTAQRRFARIVRHALRQMGNDDADIGRILCLANLQERGFPGADFDRLLPVNHVH